MYGVLYVERVLQNFISQPTLKICSQSHPWRVGCIQDVLKPHYHRVSTLKCVCGVRLDEGEKICLGAPSTRVKRACFNFSSRLQTFLETASHT